MTKTKMVLFTTLLLARTAMAKSPQPHDQQQPPQQGKAGKVDLVIALDVSGSMDGLIDSARQKLWDVVNLLGQAKPQPVLRVGLITYGGSTQTYSPSTGWVHTESELTTDLDGIYAKLFALRTSGGTEYVARAVKEATQSMKWDQDQKTLKIIFVAGNEPANQDPVVSVEGAVQNAREKGIFVNAIYCGGEGAGEALGWRNVAQLGAGKFAAIDHNRVVAINTPMDAELGRLSNELNKTYVAYGRSGGEKAANQMRQDENARSLGGMVASSRAAAKGSGLYTNDEWDLLDARKAGKKDVRTMKAEELPPAMAAMPPAERDAYLDGKAKERQKIQQEIATVNKKREAYIATERSKRAKPGQLSFDDAVTGAVKTQAEATGFGF